MLLKLTEEDIKQLHTEIERLLENDLVVGSDKINFKDYSPIINDLKKQYPQLIFQVKDFGLSIRKLQKQ